VPDSAHCYPVVFKGGETLFFAAPLGWLLKNGLWAYVALFILAGAVEVIWGKTKRSRAV
jgi:hypothetical protein